MRWRSSRRKTIQRKKKAYQSALHHEHNLGTTIAAMMIQHAASLRKQYEARTNGNARYQSGSDSRMLPINAR